MSLQQVADTYDDVEARLVPLLARMNEIDTDTTAEPTRSEQLAPQQHEVTR